MKRRLIDITQIIGIGVALIGLITFGGYLLLSSTFPADPNAGMTPETLEQSEKHYEKIRQDEMDEIKINELKGKVE